MRNTARRLFLSLAAVALLSATALSIIGQDANSERATHAPSSLAHNLNFDSSQDDTSLKLGTELVSIRVTVTDREGRAIEGLSRENFKIYEDKVEQQLSFFSNEDTPASIGVVLDASNSMTGGKIAQVKEALAHFLQTCHEQDEFFLISFCSSPEILLDGVRDGQSILDRFRSVTPEGETALYDAVGLAAQKVSHGIYPKRALIVISDGEDNHSRLSFDELRRRIQEFDLAIYPIGVSGTPPGPKPKIVTIGGFVMDRLASISGGKSFWPANAAQMDETFERIALELRRQYSIGYSPSNFTADGKWRRIKVALTIPQNFSRLVIRNREGYFAAKKTGVQSIDARRWH